MPIAHPPVARHPGAAAIRCLSPLLCGIIAAQAESRLEFVDLRLQGGLTESVGLGGALTLMCGNIGDKNVADEEPNDVGIVIGVRAGANRLKADDGVNTYRANIASIGALGGLGYYAGKRDHVELCVGYAIGHVTLADDHAGFSANDGRSTTISGELGWYHTWKRGWQLGVLGGWSWTRFACNPGTASESTAASYGVNIAGSLGYRF